MRIAWIVCLILMARSVACAETVVFRAEPRQAHVVLLGSDARGRVDVPMGVADGSPLEIPAAVFAPRAAYHFRFEMDGYQSQVVTVAWTPGQPFPQTSVVRLVPADPLRRLWSGNPALAVGIALGACLLAGLGAMRLRSRIRQDTATLREMAASVEDEAVFDPSDPYVGQEIGGYRLLERLGAGGMATVYRAAQDGEPERALKLMAEELSEDEEFRRRFLREARVGATFEHPALARVHGSGEHEGHLYLVMDLVRGTTLRERLQGGPMTLEQVLAILRPVAAGLQEAHRLGVVHRDLKPDNVMLCDDGPVKVMDFGLARGEAYTQVTKTGTVLGTPTYMAPEQILQPRTEARSDQYALGIVAYEMLAGRPPFEGDDPFAVMTAQLTEDPPPLQDLRPDLPAGAVAAIARMLRKEPEERYPSVLEAVDSMASSSAATEG